MSFQIQSLQIDAFTEYFNLSDSELVARKALRITAMSDNSYPCRVSLEDARKGEDLILMNFCHQDGDTPYHSNYAIYVREKAKQAHLAIDTVPKSFRGRLISVRGFGANDHLLTADVVAGTDLSAKIDEMFCDEKVAYIHLHNAKQGCFAARVDRA